VIVDAIDDGLMSVIEKAGLWWPKANPDHLTAAAGGYHRVGQALISAAATGTAGARQIINNNLGPATDAFTGYWKTFDGDVESGLQAAAKAASDVAGALTEFAGSVIAARDRVLGLAHFILDLVIGAAVTAVIFPPAAAFVSATGIAAAVAESLAIAGGLLEVIGTIGVTQLGVAAFAAVDGFLISLATQTVYHGHPDLHEALGVVPISALIGAVAGPPIVALKGGFNALRAAAKASPNAADEAVAAIVAERGRISASGAAAATQGEQDAVVIMNAGSRAHLDRYLLQSNTEGPHYQNLRHTFLTAGLDERNRLLERFPLGGTVKGPLDFEARPVSRTEYTLRDIEPITEGDVKLPVTFHIRKVSHPDSPVVPPGESTRFTDADEFHVHDVWWDITGALNFELRDPDYALPVQRMLHDLGHEP
jgi:hypothetical protein